jgi:hypothetical protein
MKEVYKPCPEYGETHNWKYCRNCIIKEIEDNTGIERWYRAGIWHREDGPAIIYNDYHSFSSYYLEGRYISSENYCYELHKYKLKENALT